MSLSREGQERAGKGRVQDWAILTLQQHEYIDAPASALLRPSSRAWQNKGAEPVRTVRIAQYFPGTVRLVQLQHQ